MRLILIVFFNFLIIHLCSQGRKSERDVSINFSSYTFSYCAIPNNFDLAFGPTCSLNSNGNIEIDFGFLVGIRTYKIYQGFGIMDENRNIFLLLNLNYNFMQKEKYKLFFKGGFMLGGTYYFIPDGRAAQIGYANLNIGVGMSFVFLRNLSINLAPTMRYNSKTFFPGFYLSIGFLFKSDKLK